MRTQSQNNNDSFMAHKELNLIAFRYNDEQAQTRRPTDATLHIICLHWQIFREFRNSLGLCFVIGISAPPTVHTARTLFAALSKQGGSHSQILRNHRVKVHADSIATIA